MKRTLLLFISIVLALGASTLGTLAYLTDSDGAVITFTVGKVKISVDETEVDTNGDAVGNGQRVESNAYHLVPGKSYPKDPTVTVLKGSESAYVRMLVTLTKYSKLQEISALGGANFQLEKLLQGLSPNVWILYGHTEDREADSITYEFRYHQAVDASKAENDMMLEPFCTNMVMPESITGKELLSIADFQMVIVGHAIQSQGFQCESEAWNAFDQQMNNTKGESES
ncbi:MAG: SipW-dependent-type signal peptide-containing protein [Clostridia bacterium]|nr:SipW-dependent-type signal peptide-containing protein [Clostridia bacterium]